MNKNSRSLTQNINNWRYGSGKRNSLFNLRSQQPDIDKIHLYAKDPYKAKYQFLIDKKESNGFNHFNDSKAFIEYSNDMDNIYKNIEEYKPNKKRKILIASDDMIADMLSNKKLNPIVTELFIRDRKVNISLVFVTQSYFAMPKSFRLNSMHYFIIAFNHSSDLEFEDLTNLYKTCTAKLYSFLVTDATITSDNPLRFTKNLLERI